MGHKSWITGAALGLMSCSALAADKCQLTNYASLPVTMDGTVPIVSGSINGVRGHFVADSGSFFSTLSRDGAARFKLKPAPSQAAPLIAGVGGIEQADQAIAKDFTLDGFNGSELHNIGFLVAGGNGTTSTDGAIGQNVLGFADTEFDLANGAIRLLRAKGCEGASVVYWRSTEPVSVMNIDIVTPTSPHAIGSAKLNGKIIQVLFDTGAPVSWLSLSAATRVGFNRDDPKTTSAGLTGGVGKKVLESWIARFDLLDLGGEQIKNAQLRIINASYSTGADMVLGADFFLSHRLYVANSQHKIYFTYNGGRVFDLRTDDDAKNAPQVDAGSTPTANTPPASTDEPTDAAGYRRRGAASAGRGELLRALTDLDEAVRRDASDPENFYERGLARLKNRQPVLAMDDFDQVLKLSPANIEALLLRGSLRLQNGAKESASADFSAAISEAAADSNVALRISGTYSAFGYYPEAIEHYDSWIKANRDDKRLSTALNGRCWARAMAGQGLDLALADCNAALKEGPRNSAVLDSRGMVWLRQGNPDHAITDYEASLALQPKSAWSLYGLGIAELKKGLTDKGNQHLQAAVALEPGIADQFKKLGLSP